MRISKWLLIVLVVLVVVLVVGRNYFLRAAVIKGARDAAGMDVSIGSLDVELTKSVLSVQDLIVLNPPGFGGGALLSVPGVKVDYVLKSFLEGNAFFTEIALHVKEINVIQNQDGRFNVEDLGRHEKEEKPEKEKERKKGEEGKKEEEKKPVQFRVDLLKLRIDRASFTDLESGKKEEFDLGINEEYRNITDQADIVRIIVIAALKNNLFRRATSLELDEFARRLGSQNLESFSRELQGLLEGVLKE